MANDLFLEIVPSLKPFYTLVDLVNTGKTLSEDDLKPFFSEQIIIDVLDVQKYYAQFNKKRSCGNPLFIHSLRLLIWTKVLGFSEKTMRVALYHDHVEDFGKSFSEIAELLLSIDSEIRQEVNVLTNKYKVLVLELKYLELKSCDDIKETLRRFRTNLVPSINSVLKRLCDELTVYADNPEPLDYLDSHSYYYYLKDILTFAKETGNDAVMIAKFIDRIDGTLSDLPSKFSSILNLYRKNRLFLDITKDYVKQSNNRRLKILYTLLVERSVIQIKHLKKRYGMVSELRGEFYGQQYNRLFKELVVEEEKLQKFLPVVEFFYGLKSVRDLMKELVKKD